METRWFVRGLRWRTRTIASAIDDERTTNKSIMISTAKARVLVVLPLEEYVVKKEVEEEEEIVVEDQGGVDGEIDKILKK
jgi:hypothetical protein